MINNTLMVSWTRTSVYSSIALPEQSMIDSQVCVYKLWAESPGRLECVEF